MADVFNVKVNVCWGDVGVKPISLYPLVGAQVVVTANFGIINLPLKCGYLDDEGSINVQFDKSLLTINSKPKITATIYSRTLHTIVHGVKKDDIRVLSCTKEFEGKDMELGFTFEIRNFKENRKFVIAEFMELGARFAKEEYGIEPYVVECRYPRIVTDSTSFSMRTTDTIYLDEKDAFRPKTIIHEYAHQIQYMMWSAKMTSTVKLAHTGYTDLTATTTKRDGLKLAFREGFGYYIADRVIMKYNHLFEGYACLEGITKEGSVSLNRNGALDSVHGEGVEETIEAFFYDLTDSGRDEDLFARLGKDDKIVALNTLARFDEMEFRDRSLFRVFNAMEEMTLYQFVTKFYDIYPGYKERVNFLLSLHGIAPYAIRTKSLDLKNDKIEIAWEPGGSYSRDAKTGHNKTVQEKFVVTIFDPEGKVIIGSTETKNKSYSFPYSKIKKYVSSSNYVLAKVKGISDRSKICYTEYESAYFCIHLVSAKVNDSKLVLFPDIFSPNSDVVKVTVVDGLKVTTKCSGLAPNNTNTVEFGEGSDAEISLETNDYNNIELELEDFRTRRGGYYQMTVQTNDGASKVFKYPSNDTGKRIMANLSACPRKIYLESFNGINERTAIKRIVLSKKLEAPRPNGVYSGARDKANTGVSGAIKNFEKNSVLNKKPLKK